MAGTANFHTLGLVLVFLLLGGLAYYTYTLSTELGQKNLSLQEEALALGRSVVVLQGNISRLQASLLSSESQQSYLTQQAAYFQTLLQQQESQQSMNSQQIAATEALLKAEEGELSTITMQVAGLQKSSETLAEVSLEIQNISAEVKALESGLQSITPSVFLRTQGTALASYVEGPMGYTYLRLTETGPGSLVESALGTTPFNATVPGNSVSWEAVANSVASDPNHWFWPLVLEDSPGGMNAIEFEDAGGTQEAAVVSNGIRTVHLVGWDPTVVHTFMVVVVSPGQQVDFYIDGVKVTSITAGIPTSGFLLEGAEVKGVGPYAQGVACIDTYGGILGSQ